MSAFATQARSHAREFDLSRRKRWTLYAHYPAFRLAHEVAYASGVRRRVARGLLGLLSPVRFRQTLRGRREVTFLVRLTASDLGTYREVFFGRAYPVPLDDARVLVDTGSNSGMATAYLAATYPLQQVLLVEANPNLLSQLHVVAGSVGCRADVVHAAVTTANGTVGFVVDDNHRHSRIGSGSAVPGRTLRSLLDDHGLAHVDILKMDIEGEEHAVIEHDPEVLDRVRCLMLELHGDAGRRDATLRILEQQFDDLSLERDDAVDFVVATRGERGAAGRA